MIAKVKEKEIFNDNSMIYLENVEIVKIGNNQDEVEKFTLGKNHRLEFQINIGEKSHQRNIKVFGFTKKIIGEKKYFLGYLPKEITETIIEGNFFDFVMPSPPSFRQDGRIFFDLQGSIGKIKNFKSRFEQVLQEEGFLK